MKKWLLGIIVAISLATAGLTAGCAATNTPPMPSAVVVSYMGTNYCPYRYSPYEIDMYGHAYTCTRVAFPSISVVPSTGTLQWALANQYATYSSWYDSGWYYDTYLAPIAPRYHVTISVSRTIFLSNAASAERTYAPLIRTDSSKARYVGKNGNTTNKYSFPTSNTKAKNTGPVTNAGSSGGNSGNSSLFGGSSTGNSRTTTTNRAPTRTTGKSGRR